jgi:hypothetical protein
MSLLSDKIANTRLIMDAQNKVHSLDEFRSTVNYVNTTNKEGPCRLPATVSILLYQ